MSSDLPGDALKALADCRTPFLIGVRHHSAALARVIPELLGHFRPHAVLVEMPPDFRTWLEPLFETDAATRNFERFIAGFDNRQTVAVAPLLRKLRAPTLIVWGTSDPFFPVKWAYWLRGAIPGAREVVELKGAKLFFPWERPEQLAHAVREFWQ